MELDFRVNICEKRPLGLKYNLTGFISWKSVDCLGCNWNTWLTKDKKWVSYV